MMTIVLHRIDEWLLRMAWVPSVILFATLAILAAQAADRRVPFKIMSVSPAEAHAGGNVTIYAKVWRDVSRDCSVRMSRWALDADNVRTDYPLSEFPAEMIRQFEDETPGELKVDIPLSKKAVPGVGRLFSHLKYRCNLGHWLLPVEVTTVMPFTVLP